MRPYKRENRFAIICKYYRVWLDCRKLFKIRRHINSKYNKVWLNCRKLSKIRRDINFKKVEFFKKRPNISKKHLLFSKNLFYLSKNTKYKPYQQTVTRCEFCETDRLVFQTCFRKRSFPCTQSVPSLLPSIEPAAHPASRF